MLDQIEWSMVLAAGAVFVMGAISPGPSLAVVIRNTLLGGRRRGLACALGHGIGFGIYAGAAVLSMVAIIETAEVAALIMQGIGSILLVWFGWKMWTKKIEEEPEEAIDHVAIDAKNGKARYGFVEGFLIAFLNPKIGLFMLAILSQVLYAGMNFPTKAIIAGLGMTIDTTWYLLVALILTGTPLLEWLRTRERLVMRVMAVILWSFSSVFFVEMLFRLF